MQALRNPLKWLYHEFGVASVYHTGPDAWLIILARTCRMFAFGAVSLIIALFMSSLSFSDFRIGLFMTLTLVGDVFLSLSVALVADRIGRRRILFAGGALMVFSGVMFSIFENYWILLFAAVVGVVSATGGDFGPFRSVEESTLSHLTTLATRSDVMAWYVTTSALGSALGTEVAGRVTEYLRRKDSRTATEVYHYMFWFYIAMGIMTMVASWLMSAKCEATEDQVPKKDRVAAEPLLEDDHDEGEEEASDDGGNGQHGSRRSSRDTIDMAAASDSDAQPKTSQSRFLPSRARSHFRSLLTTSRLGQISPESRAIVYKLWTLLTIDSLADGMVSYALTNYYLARKFDVKEDYLGDIMSIGYFLTGLSTIFAGPLAKRLGLINTMVFTHLPSSTAVLLFPIPQSLPLTIVLLFIRTGLNNMDQAPRAAFIAAVVKPGERTAVMGITAMLRTLGSTIGPSLTGFLAGSDKFWIAFVIAGALRIGYDLGLFYMFVGLDLAALEAANQKDGGGGVSDEEDEEDIRMTTVGGRRNSSEV